MKKLIALTLALLLAVLLLCSCGVQDTLSLIHI